MPKKTKRAAEPANGSKTLVVRVKPNQTPEAATAEMAIAGLASNAVTAVNFTKGTFGEVSLNETVAALADSVRAVHGGDLKGVEALLTAQAVALNAIFTELSQRAALNVGEYLDAADRYMRLALKAQGQCRATLETLAAIKNPPTVFARQANIAQGPQQVNNTLSLAGGDPQPLARAGNLETEQNKLLEPHGERLDTRATGTTGAGDQALAAVGTRHRTAND